MTEFENKVRLFVMEFFVNHGHAPLDQSRAPSMKDVALGLNERLDRVRAAFQNLAAIDALFLEPDSQEIRMAVPFSAVQTDTTPQVTVGKSSWWTNCAMDALGITGVLGKDSFIAAKDPLNPKKKMRIDVTEKGPSSKEAKLVHFLMPQAQGSEDKVYT